METITLLLGGINDVVLAAGSDGLVTSIRNFVGPIVLLACGLAALTFLFQRQMMQMVIFIIIGIVVLAVFYAPEFLKSLGESLGTSQKDIQWG